MIHISRLGLLPVQDDSVRYPTPNKIINRLYGVSPAPERYAHTGIDPDPQMFGNDTLSDCSSVATANGIRALNRVIHQSNKTTIPVLTSNVIRFYSQSCGYDPARPETDRGADMDHVYRYLATTGYPTQQETYFPLIGKVDHEDHELLRKSHALFGVLNVGVALAKADMTMGLWDTDTVGDQTPGSWGWHLLNLWEYDGKADTDIVTLLTFGVVQKATWRWLKSRMVFAHGLAYHQMVTPSQRTVNDVLWRDFLYQNQDVFGTI